MYGTARPRKDKDGPMVRELCGAGWWIKGGTNECHVRLSRQDRQSARSAAEGEDRYGWTQRAHLEYGAERRQGGLLDDGNMGLKTGMWYGTRENMDTETRGG